MPTMPPFTLQMTHAREVEWYRRGIRNLVIRWYSVVVARTTKGEMCIFVTLARDPYDVFVMSKYEVMLWIPMKPKGEARIYRYTESLENERFDLFAYPLPVHLDWTSLGLRNDISVVFPDLGNLSLRVEEIFDNLSEIMKLPTSSSLLSEYIRLRRRLVGPQEGTIQNPRARLRLVVR